MLKINMFSSADKVAGQGVGSAYVELMGLLKKYFPDQFKVTVNRFGERSDVSHYHTIDPQFYLSTFSDRRGRKIGYVHFLPETLEGSLKIPQPFRGWFYQYVIQFYKRMDELVVVNPSFIDKLVADGIPREKVTYIPNFVAKKEFHPEGKAVRQQMRKKLGLGASDFVVFGNGQVQERKGVADFIKLAVENPDIQFVWAGGFSFGRMTDGYSDFKRVIANPPANLKFTNIVPRKDLIHYYNMADLFLLPSYDELFPMSVLEAFSCGTPVLLRDLDLYRAIITGYYQPAADEAAMNDQIRRFRRNPAALANLRQRALAGAAHYSEPRLAKIWQQFYAQQAALAKGTPHDTQE
ncbi:glycosyltransferase [Lactobacillus selangorensis]|uniref:Glycosyltransferase n=1 Tax=Lactobacillus selangorensis TaxID=81857 RepID=A0A0R2FJ05_9LACO|nr:glycosyltransferase family 4 protein [Lactobacillus selangorensis]KRN27766.1 glycosyltransferase [Lactobacillus selangorensis]KRN30269.1 glycosyltransferase [Lactobacillus selangorensis]